MLAVSDLFRASLLESHRVTVAATIDSPGEAPVAAQVVGGSLKLDRGARSRRQGSIVVGFDLAANLDYVRSLAFGGYVKLERGILFADGTFERPPIGYLRVENVSWSELEGQATLELADRMAQVQDEAFPVPWTPTGMLPSDACVAAVYDVFGDTINYHVSVDTSSETPLVDTVFDQDRGQAVADLAASISASAYFDAVGDFVLEPNPGDPADATPDWDLDVGPNGTLEEVQENLDRSGVRNGVAVRGQPAADMPPIYSLAIDDDPTSPTRWGGPFGKVALVVSLQSVQSQEQADSTAASLLNLRLGLARAISLRGVPMPALEADDVIRATYLDGRTEHLRVQTVQLPLTVDGAMEITASAHYSGVSITPTRRRRERTISVSGGARAWRELDDAVVVTS